MGDAVVWWYRGIDWCERSERLRSRGDVVVVRRVPRRTGLPAQLTKTDLILCLWYETRGTWSRK